MGLATLKEFLTDWTLEGRTRGAVAETVLALAETSTRLSEFVGRGALGGKLGRVVARAGESDEQKEIDVVANNMIAEALKSAPVAALASEEELLPRALQADAPLLVATDPRTSTPTSRSVRSSRSCRAIRRPLAKPRFFAPALTSLRQASSFMGRK